MSLSCFVASVYFVIAFFRPARRTPPLRTFPLQTLIKMLPRLMPSFLSLMGVTKKAPFCCMKSRFLMYKKPLFEYKKGAFLIIMLREKNDDIKALFRRIARGWFRRERNMFRVYASAWGKCRFSLISKIITELLRSRCRLKTGFSSV